MTDKNGTPIIPGQWVWAIPEGQDVPRVIMVTSVTGSGQDMGVEVIQAEDSRVQAFFSNGGFEGGGGGFGGGGASGGW